MHYLVSFVVLAVALNSVACAVCEVDPTLACYEKSKPEDILYPQQLDFAQKLRETKDPQRLVRARILLKGMVEKSPLIDDYKPIQAQAIYAYVAMVDSGEGAAQETRNREQEHAEIMSLLKRGAHMEQGKISGKMARLYALFLGEKGSPEEIKHYNELAQKLGFEF